MASWVQLTDQGTGHPIWINFDLVGSIHMRVIPPNTFTVLQMSDPAGREITVSETQDQVMQEYREQV